METNNTAPETEPTNQPPDVVADTQPGTADTQAADAAATQEGAPKMAAKKEKKNDGAVVVRISGEAAVALKSAIEAATKKSGFTPRAGQVIEAALIAYAK